MSIFALQAVVIEWFARIVKVTEIVWIREIAKPEGKNYQ